MNKALAAKCLCGALAALLFCTVVSIWVENAMIPTVEVVECGYAALEQSLEATAVVQVTPEDGLTSAANGNWLVREVYVKAGDTVEQGDALFLIDISDYIEQTQNLATEIQQQTNTLNGTDWTGGDRLVLEMQLATLQRQYKTLCASYPSNGIVKAEHSGLLKEISAAPGETLSAYQLYARYESGQEAYQAAWSLGAETGWEYQACTEATISLLTGVTENYSLTNIKSEQNEDGSWSLTADLPPEYSGALGSGLVKMVASKTSYDNVVLRGCLQTDDNENYYIYYVQEQAGIFGRQYVIQMMSVRLLDHNNLYAAISVAGSDSRL